jgi:TfoX/Sxy family transcriptional regulator of competence genes
MSEDFESLADAALAVSGVTRRTMFGRDTLLADGHPFAFLDGDRVALKLPDAADLVAAGEGIVPRMGNREMRQWISIPASSPVTERLEIARRFVIS